MGGNGVATTKAPVMATNAPMVNTGVAATTKAAMFGATATPGAATQATAAPAVGSVSSNATTGSSGCSASCQNCVGVVNSGIWATDAQCAKCASGSTEFPCNRPNACKCADGNSQSNGNAITTE